jgi:hypothetical protein|tara:strand:+ start:604 stop:990 length:387 start_codon:yes stop_codon:yes gene_type:complete
MDIQNTLIEFFSNYDKIAKLYRAKEKEVSRIDRELADFYHRVEGTHLTHNTQGHGLILQLQDILERRRGIKLEVNLMKSFMSITSPHMNTAITKNTSVLQKHINQLKEISDTGGKGYDGKNTLKISLD